VVEQVAQREQAGAQPLEHRYPVLPQPGGLVGVHGAGQVAQHDQGLGGLRRRVQGGQGIGLVSVGLADQVDGERDRVHRRVAGQGDQRAGEQPPGVRPGAPHVERVGGRQARVQDLRQPGPGRLADDGERHAGVLGQVSRVRALQPGVMHGRDAAAGGRAGPGGGQAAARARPAAADREQLQGVGELREVADPVHAVGAGERLPAPVARGERAGMRRHHLPPAGRAPCGEQDDGQVTAGGEGEDPAEPVRLPDGLEDQGEDPRLRQPQRVVQVGRRGGDQFLAGGDREGVADGPAGPQHRGEHRAGVGDQGDRPRGQRLGLGITDHAQPAGHVHEAHAAGAAQLQAGRPGHGGQPLPQPRPAGRRLVLVGVAEDHRRAVAAPGGQRQLLLQRGVGHGEQDQVDRAVEVGQRRDAPPPGDLGVLRVDQVDLGPGRAPGHLRDHPLPERARPRRRADQRDAARLQHRRQRGRCCAGG
jgi:hypothetical protein